MRFLFLALFYVSFYPSALRAETEAQTEARRSFAPKFVSELSLGDMQLDGGRTQEAKVMSASLGVKRGRTTVSLVSKDVKFLSPELNATTLGVRAQYDFLRMSRVDFYAFAHFYAAHASSPLTSGFGMEAGMGAALKLSEHAQFFAEVSGGRFWSQTGRGLRTSQFNFGLRFTF